MITENIEVTGEFQLSIYENGKLKCSSIEKNLVVDFGKSNVAKLLGGSIGGQMIQKISVGTNGIAPTVADITITGAFSKNIDLVSYPESNSVMFSFSLESTEANGMTIREFGLLNTGNVLFARKVRSDIVKTNAIRLVGTWKITIN